MASYSLVKPAYRVVFQCDGCDQAYERHNPGRCACCHSTDISRYHIPTDSEFASWSDAKRAAYCAKSRLPKSAKVASEFVA